jgi:hypothetical protein
LTFPFALFLYGIVLGGAHTHPILFIRVVASLGLSSGTPWEIAEWSCDQVLIGNVIKGKMDTVTDLIVDAIGAVIAGSMSLMMVKA